MLFHPRGCWQKRKCVRTYRSSDPILPQFGRSHQSERLRTIRSLLVSVLEPSERLEPFPLQTRNVLEILRKLTTIISRANQVIPEFQIPYPDTIIVLDVAQYNPFSSRNLRISCPR